MKNKTVGISPKTIAATVAAVLAYLLTQQVVDFPAWADLLLTAVGVGFATFQARPGDVVRDPSA